MKMRRVLSLAVAMLLAGGLSAPAFAQAEPQVTISHEMSPDPHAAELQAFDQVAIANPGMSHRLAANPRLAVNTGFLNKYPDLNNFFSKYPGSRERFLDDPGNYLEGVHMHNGRLVRRVHRKKSQATSETKSEAAPAAPASPPAEAPAAPAAPEAATPPPAAPPSNP